MEAAAEAAAIKVGIWTIVLRELSFYAYIYIYIPGLFLFYVSHLLLSPSLFCLIVHFLLSPYRPRARLKLLPFEQKLKLMPKLWQRRLTRGANTKVSRLRIWMSSRASEYLKHFLYTHPYLLYMPQTQPCWTCCWKHFPKLQRKLPLRWFAPTRASRSWLAVRAI